MTDPSVPPSAEPPPTPPASRFQGLFWFGLMLAVVAVLAGTSIAIGAYQAAGDPATVVRAYFAALSNGDAATALGYGTVPPGRHDLLTSDVLAAQNAAAQIENLTVLAVRQRGDRADVVIGYVMIFGSGRTTVQDTVPVVRHGHDWRLVASAVPVAVDPGDGSTLATFAGSVVPHGNYPMFPGAVPVTYRTPNLELDSASRAVRFGGDGTLQVNAQVSAAGRRLITPAVRAALAACLAGRGRPQALCPVPDPEQGVPGSLRGTMPRQGADSPQLVVDSADGKIDITEEASVTGTYQQLDENNIASAATARKVGLHAHCFATVPGTIIWDVTP
jgi:hypothetical protein